MTYDIACIKCGEVHHLKLDIRKFNRWRQKRENIQDVFPELSPEDRELMISQICGKCWEEMFGGEENDN